MLDSGEILVVTTVLLEVEWVLRSGYRFDRTSIAEALEGLLSLPNVHLAQPGVVRRALAGYAGGLDLADAIHWASSGSALQFATFDGAFCRRASALNLKPVVVEP